MIYGTSHFRSIFDARNYYKGYGYGDYQETRKAVQYKLDNGEIHIGKPELKEGQKLLLNAKEGRYFIED